MKYFINFVPEYNSNYYTFNRNNNYVLQPSYIADSMGYQCVFILKNGKDFLINDKNFLQGSTVIAYKNIFDLVRLILKYNNKDNIFYVNSVSLPSFIIGALSKKSIFISHGQNDKRGIIRQTIYNMLISSFSRIRINSLGDMKFMSEYKHLQSKLFYLPLAINQIDFKIINHDSKTRRDLVILGSMRPCKGLGTMLQAFNIVHSYYPETKLHIVGYIHDDDYGKYVNKYNLESSVIKHGFMPAGEGMNAILNNCAIYMNSSTTEGQCLAAYESALSGLGLCVPNISAFKYNLADCALFHEVNDYEQLAKNVIFFLENEDERKKSNLRAIEMIKDNYDIKVIEHKMRDLLTF